MQTAWLTKTTDEYDALLSWQCEDPDERRALTDAEQATLDTILAAEDGSVVVAATGNGWDDALSTDATPVWWVPSDEAPRAELMIDSTEHTTWEGGYTWPREDAPCNISEPQDLAVTSCREDYSWRSEATRNAERAADIATADVLNDPAGWLRLVPTHWQPGAWLDCYRTAYVVAWAERAAEA